MCLWNIFHSSFDSVRTYVADEASGSGIFPYASSERSPVHQNVAAPIESVYAHSFKFTHLQVSSCIEAPDVPAHRKTVFIVPDRYIQEREKFGRNGSFLGPTVPGTNQVSVTSTTRSPPILHLSSFQWLLVVEHLRPLHYASFRVGKRFPTVHGRPVVPHDKVADLPMMCPLELRLRLMCDQGIE